MRLFAILPKENLKLMSNNEKQSILVVEDDPTMAEIIEEMIREDYSVFSVSNCESALRFIDEILPDLVLLDINMPGMNGVELCKELRKNRSRDDFAVIFISALADESQRIECYQAGGDDFLSKPVMATELKYKVNLALTRILERRALSSELTSSFATTMSALTTASEIGIVLNFLRLSFACDDYRSLCAEVVEALNCYELHGAVQIRGRLGSHSLGTNGICSAFDESILNKMFGHSRLFEFSSCLSCNYPNIIIIVKNLDRGNSERRGRMKDNIAFLAEAANVRIEAIDKSHLLIEKHQIQSRLVTTTRAALHEIEQRQFDQLSELDQIFQDLQDSFEERLITLGLTETQESDLTALIQCAMERSKTLYRDGLSTEASLKKILSRLDTI